MKLATQDSTSLVAAIQLAASVFFLNEIATQDSTNLVAANQLAAGAVFLFCENSNP